MLDALTAEDFQPHIGTEFHLTPHDGAGITSELIEVADHTSTSTEEPPRARFTLLFRAPVGATAGQGMFRVEREGAETLEIFLVPVGPTPEADGMLYEAVFA